MSSTAAAFISALRTQLQARAGLAGVDVHIVPQDGVIGSDSIVLIASPVTGDQEYATAGRARRDDHYTIPGQLAGYATGTDTDTTMQAAWDRAATILGEIADQLLSPPQVGDQTLSARLSQISYQPQPSDKGGWVCVCGFQIDYTARVT